MAHLMAWDTQRSIFSKQMRSRRVIVQYFPHSLAAISTPGHAMLLSHVVIPPKRPKLAHRLILI